MFSVIAAAAVFGGALIAMDSPAMESWTLKGSYARLGINEDLELTFDSAGHFRRNLIGSLPESIGFDGKAFWEMNWSGIPHTDEGEGITSMAVVTAIQTGTWQNPIFRRVVASDEGGETTYTISPVGRRYEATLTVDATTKQPKRLTHWTPTGPATWTFEDFRKMGNRSVPRTTTYRAGNETETIRIDAMSTVKTTPTTFQLPKPDYSDVTYNSSVSPSIEVKFMYDHVFVRPKIDGVEGGWFFLDTGAEAMCIDTQFAKQLGAKELGHQETAGVVGSDLLGIVQTKTFSVGPFSYKDPIFLTLDLSPFSKAIGLPLAGIVGYDALARGQFEIDPKAKTVSILPIGAVVPGEAKDWFSFNLKGRVPAMTCRFDGKREGRFQLDTGSGATVDFYSPTVERLKLKEGRKLKGSMTGGVGGVMESALGTIPNFDFAGHRFENPEVGFQSTQKGEFSNPFMDGNIGQGFMDKFRLVLDYPKSRILFVYQGK